MARRGCALYTPAAQHGGVAGPQAGQLGFALAPINLHLPRGPTGVKEFALRLFNASSAADSTTRASGARQSYDYYANPLCERWAIAGARAQ